MLLTKFYFSYIFIPPPHTRNPHFVTEPIKSLTQFYKNPFSNWGNHCIWIQLFLERMGQKIFDVRNMSRCSTQLLELNMLFKTAIRHLRRENSDARTYNTRDIRRIDISEVHLKNSHHINFYNTWRIALTVTHKGIYFLKL